MARIGRPRKVPQSDEGVFNAHDNTEYLIPHDLMARYVIPEADRRASMKFLRETHHRVRNSFNDPLSFLWVIDTLQKASPKIRFRSPYVADYLNLVQDAIWFEPNNTGRILGEIAKLADEQYSEAAFRTLRPVIQEADWRGRYYIINELPSTYEWLWELRKRIEVLAREDKARESKGRPTADRPWLTPEIEDAKYGFDQFGPITNI